MVLRLLTDTSQSTTTSIFVSRDLSRRTANRWTGKTAASHQSTGSTPANWPVTGLCPTFSDFVRRPVKGSAHWFTFRVRQREKNERENLLLEPAVNISNVYKQQNVFLSWPANNLNLINFKPPPPPKKNIYITKTFIGLSFGFPKTYGFQLTNTAVGAATSIKVSRYLSGQATYESAGNSPAKWLIVANASALGPVAVFCPSFANSVSFPVGKTKRSICAKWKEEINLASISGDSTHILARVKECFLLYLRC